MNETTMLIDVALGYHYHNFTEYYNDCLQTNQYISTGLYFIAVFKGVCPARFWKTGLNDIYFRLIRSISNLYEKCR